MSTVRPTPPASDWAVEAEQRYPQAFAQFQPLLKELTGGMERHYLGQSAKAGLFEGGFLLLLLFGAGWAIHKVLAPTWTDPFLHTGRWIVVIGLVVLVGVLCFLWFYLHYLRHHTPALHLYQGQGAEIEAFWTRLLARNPSPAEANQAAQNYLNAWQAKEARLHMDAFPKWEKHALWQLAIQWGLFFFCILGLVYYFLFCGAWTGPNWS